MPTVSGTTAAVLDAPHRSKTRQLSDIPARARKLAAEAIGIDSHIDTVQRVLVMGEDLGKRIRATTTGQIQRPTSRPTTATALRPVSA